MGFQDVPTKGTCCSASEGDDVIGFRGSSARPDTLVVCLYFLEAIDFVAAFDTTIVRE